MLTKTRTPKKFEANWEDDGTLAQSFIIFNTLIEEDGKELSRTIERLPVGMAGAAGFPIAQVLDALNVTALTDAATKDAALTKATADLATAIADKEFSQTKEHEATANAALLQTKLDSYTATVDANGVPVSITMVQAREQLIRMGLNDTVQTALNAMPGVDGEIARMKYDTSPTISRTSALIAALAQIIGKDNTWLDQFFIDASTR